MNETRTLSHLLHPPLLDEVGFASAATSYVQEFARRSGIEIDISVDLPNRLQADTEILLFRVLQESLTNIHRHSGSRRAKIRAGIEGEEVSLEIRDYGHGIPQEVLESFKTSGNGAGVGLAGIRERLREVDGQLDLSSSGDGTVLRVSLLATNARESYRSSRCRSALSNFAHAELPVALILAATDNKMLTGRLCKIQLCITKWVGSSCSNSVFSSIFCRTLQAGELETRTTLASSHSSVPFARESLHEGNSLEGQEDTCQGDRGFPISLLGNESRKPNL